MRSIKRASAAGLAATLALAATLVLSSVPAGAKDGDVIRTGSCGGRSDWKLKLSEEDAGIEVEYEVDQNRTGDRWRVVLRHDGKKFLKKVKRTKGASGSFEVRRVRNNHRGVDRFRGKATNLRTGEVCRGRASF